MNLIVIPFHDWKVSTKEGFRTRDAHLYKHFMNNEKVEKIVILNRPTSLIEFLLRRKKLKSSTNIVYKNRFSYISQVKENVFVLDILVPDFFSVIAKRHAWIPFVYQQERVIRFVKRAITFLKMSDYSIYTSSPFSVLLIQKLEPEIVLLDAIDNFTKYRMFRHFRNEIIKLYKIAKKDFNLIICNSSNTKDYLSHNCKADLEVIPNGVDINYFRKDTIVPKDMQSLVKPIVGYAGKMFDVFDVDLLRILANKYKYISFVLIGKFLDNNWMKGINGLENVFYLGDKKYDILPNYVNNFDICFIPYIIEKWHDGDPIKFYEYMAASKPIISTNIGEIWRFNNGINIVICNSRLEFINEFDRLIKFLPKSIKHKIPKELSWKFKADHIIELISKT